MSNHLAIATVTAAFGRLLGSAAQTGVPNAIVRLGPPDAKTGQDGKPIVNLFCYQITPNAEQRSAHMPGRRPDGSLANRSRVALDLRYVLSFYGDAAKFEPERMAAAVAVAVEDRPLFSAEMIRKAVQDNAAVLQGSDLEDALSNVRITPDVHSLDDLSKMWSIFFQVPYALSISYVCSHVTIEIGEEAQRPLPVAASGIYVAPFGRVAIDEILAAEGAGQPILWGGTLLIRGRRLNAPGLALRIAGQDVALSPGEADATSIRLKLEAARLGGEELPAGVHAVQAVLPPPPGAPAHLARASDARVFVLRPKLTVTDPGLDPNAPADAANGEMTVEFVPSVVEGQTVRLMLDERTAADPQAATLLPQEPSAFPAAELVFPYADLKRAKFLVRAQVDGVESAPEIDTAPGSATFGQIIGPEVDLT